MVRPVLFRMDAEQAHELAIRWLAITPPPLLPGMEAAFLDFGASKNGVLYASDVASPGGNGKSQKRIEQVLKEGDEVLVQVTKDAMGAKGARLTGMPSLPGRYLILTPFSDGCGISRKIEDPVERKRLKQLINELTIPEGMGVIVRTAGEGKKPRYFVRDLHLLLAKWQEIQRKMETERAPACLYQEPDIVERTVRDFLTEDIDRVLVDSEEDYKRTLEYVGQISSRSKSKIVHYKDSIPVFERYNIERQIEQTFQRRVPLPSGGEIVIDETEALISIDVNTGSHKSKSGDEKNTIFQVNMEAAVEIARQIRLRNIGGLVIMDFIDMKERRHRNAVYDKMVELMSEDKAKTHILPISQLGLMEMTRQRHSESVHQAVYDDCPYCRGRGKVKSALTMSVEIQRKLAELHERIARFEASGNTRMVPATRGLIAGEERNFALKLLKIGDSRERVDAQPSLLAAGMISVE